MPVVIPRQPERHVRLDPEPILAAVESYRGTIIDLDRGLRVEAQPFAAGRQNLVAELKGLGVERGQAVVLAIGNGPTFPAALAAILTVGASPLVVHAETPAPELLRLAARIGAGWLVVDGLDDRALESHNLVAGMLASVPWVATAWARTGVTVKAAALPWEGVPLHATSGTTGVPKVAIRPGYCAIEEARHYAETLDITPADTVLAVTPQSHAYAYGMGTMVPLLTGAKLITTRRFHPAAIARALGELDVSILPAVPMMLEMLLAGNHWPAAMPRCVLSAGSPLAERTAREFRQRTGRDVRPLYGSTETGGISIAPCHQVAGCVGPPMQGVEVDVRSQAASHWGADVGLVHIRSSSMMAGYLQDGAIDDTMLPDGWFTPGDLGRVDAAGAIHLKGRMADVINVHGLKVVPLEVEEVLASLPGVEEVKVYAGERSGGEALVKVAVVAPQLDVAAIQTYCEQQLVYYKRPAEIHLLPALPKTPTGKILRAKLP